MEILAPVHLYYLDTETQILFNNPRGANFPGISS